MDEGNGVPFTVEKISDFSGNRTKNFLISRSELNPLSYLNSLFLGTCIPINIFGTLAH